MVEKRASPWTERAKHVPETPPSKKPRTTVATKLRQTNHDAAQAPKGGGDASPSLSFASLVEAACAEAEGFCPGECPSPMSGYTVPRRGAGSAATGAAHAKAAPAPGGAVRFTEDDIAMECRLRELIRTELSKIKAAPARNTSVVAKAMMHLGAFYHLRGCTYQGGRYARKAWAIYRRFCRVAGKDVQVGAVKFVANLESLGCAELWDDYCKPTASLAAA